MQKVICSFPGTGKSTISNNAEQYGLNRGTVFYDDRDGISVNLLKSDKPSVFDSDSSIFPKENFPGNYVDHIAHLLSWNKDCVIMVSSHDNVRQALRDAGIDYVLVYPQRELKEEYIQRYISRGSPESFVAMMGEKWNDFIDSCESDPTPNKIVLTEGEYLSDRFFNPDIVEVTGSESIGDIIMNSEGHAVAVWGGERPKPIHKAPMPTTASIIDINSQALINVVQAEGIQNNDPSVLNIPENNDTGSVTSTDQGVDFVADSGLSEDSVDGSESQSDIDRTELIEAKFDMENDIDVIERVVESCRDEDVRDGLEGYEDNGPVFTAAVEDIKERYNVDVEPTIAGIEGFLDNLKAVYSGIKKALSSGNGVEGHRIIKQKLADAEKAAGVYATAEWQDKQKFINVGKTKLPVPGVFKEVSSIGDLTTIINLVTKQVDATVSKYDSNIKKRLQAGLKVFNQYKGKAPDDKEAQSTIASIDIQPPILKGALEDSGVKNVDIKTSSLEIPVLNKDDVVKASKLLQSIVSHMNDNWTKINHTLDGMVYEEDIYKSKFWDSNTNSKGFGNLWDAITYDGAGELLDVGYGYDTVFMAIGQFIERWILGSVK